MHSPDYWSRMWDFFLIALGVCIPGAMLIGLIQTPSWGNLIWLIGFVFVGWCCISAARYRRRRRNEST